MQEQDVIDYLRKKPDFFAQHTDLLEDLYLPHSTGPASSLIERQVSVLREQNQTLKQQLHELIQIARDNSRIYDRLNSLSRSMLDINNAEELMTVLHECLFDDFQVDVIMIHLLKDCTEKSATETPIQIQTLEKDTPNFDALESILVQGTPECGQLRPTVLNALFGNSAEQIKSAAIIPLKYDHLDDSSYADMGLLAIGSVDVEHFQQGMGTSFLSELGKTISVGIKRYILQPGQQ